MSDFFVDAIKDLVAKKDAAIARVDDLGNVISDKDKLILKKLPEAEYSSAVNQLLATIPHHFAYGASDDPPSAPTTSTAEDIMFTSSNHPVLVIPPTSVPASPTSQSGAFKTNVVSPDMEPPFRSKRARTVPSYEQFHVFDQPLCKTATHVVDAQTEAERALLKDYEWKKISHFKKEGDVDKYINPQGNFYKRGVKRVDKVLGEDYFFDVQEALKYAQQHNG